MFYSSRYEFTCVSILLLDTGTKVTGELGDPTHQPPAGYIFTRDELTTSHILMIISARSNGHEGPHNATGIGQLRQEAQRVPHRLAVLRTFLDGLIQQYVHWYRS